MLYWNDEIAKFKFKELFANDALHSSPDEERAMKELGSLGLNL